MVEKLPDLGLSKKAAWWEGRTELPKFNKNFYKESERIKSMQETQVKGIREAFEISILGKPDQVPRPVTEFSEASLPRYLTEQLTDKFDKPTPIQSQSWPIIMSGRDMVGIAATGSGKTLAFLLPAIVHVNDQPVLEEGDGPIVLILTPTRELAMQIQEEADKFAGVCKINTTAVYGGVPRPPQQQKLEEGAEILIATPGRLIDFIDTGVVNFKRVTYLVLDEADRMLDLGFEKQIQRIEKHIRPDRQTQMFSATWPKEVEQLAKNYCQQDPVHIQVGKLQISANSNVIQEVTCVEELDKYDHFRALLQKLDGQRILVFCETKKGVNELVQKIKSDQIWRGVAGIHGDKRQDERDALINAFKDGKRISLLVATDVVGRGLDVKDISAVINYDMPFQIEDYVHRVGRTARAGASGTSYTFFTKRNFMMAPDLIKVLEQQERLYHVPEPLKQLAIMALKATSTDAIFRRRWRKLGVEENQNKKVVKVSDLIKQKEEQRVLNEDTVTEVVQDQNNDGLESTAPVVKALEEPMLNFSGQYFDDSNQPEKQSEQVSKETKPINKKKWGQK